MTKRKFLFSAIIAVFALCGAIILGATTLKTAKADDTTIIAGLEVKMNKAEEGNEISSLFEFDNQEEMLLKVPEGAPYTAKLVDIQYNTGMTIYEDGADWSFFGKTKIKRNEPYIVRVNFMAKEGHKLDVSDEGENYVESMKVTGLETGKGKDVEVWSGSGYSKDGSSKEIKFVYSLGISRLGLYPSIYPEIGKAVTTTYATSYTDTAYWIAGAPGPFEYKAIVAPLGTEVQTVNVFGKSTCHVQLTAVNAMSGGTMLIRATAADGQTIDLPIKVNAVSGGHKHTYGELEIIDYEYHGRTTCSDPECLGVAPVFDEDSEYEKHDFKGGCTKICSICGDVGNPDGAHNFVWEYNEEDTAYHYKKCGCGELEKNEDGSDLKEAHYGGKANCYFGATCVVCNRVYTEKGEHKYEFAIPDGTLGKKHYCICVYCGKENSDYGHAPTGGTASCARRAVCEYENNGVKCGLEYGDYVSHSFNSENECFRCGTPKYIKNIEITIPDWVEGGSVSAVKVPVINEGKIYTDANSTWFGYSKAGVNPKITNIDNNIRVSYHFFAQANCKFWGKIDDINVTVNGKGEFYGKRFLENGSLEVNVMLRHPDMVQDVSLDFGTPMEAHNVGDLKITEKNGLEIVDIKDYYDFGEFIKGVPGMLYVTLKAPEGKKFEKPMSYEDMFCDFKISGAEYYTGTRAKISEDGTLLTVLVSLPKAVECDHEGAMLTEGKAPTCTEDGVIDKFVCPYCEKAFKDIGCTEVWNESERIIHATGHKYDETKFEPDKTSHYHVCETCKEKVGEEEHKPDRDGATEDTPVKCTACGYIITPALGHKHNLSLVPEVPATCIKEGKKAYYVCDGCSEKFGDQSASTVISDENVLVIPKAHKFGQWIAEVPATKESEGVKAHKDCEFCGKHFDNDGNEIIDLTIDKLPSDDKDSDSVESSGEVIKPVESSGEVIEPAKEGLSGGAIAGIVIGSVAVAGIGGFAIFWFVIKKKTFADIAALFEKK